MCSCSELDGLSSDGASNSSLSARVSTVKSLADSPWLSFLTTCCFCRGGGLNARILILKLFLIVGRVSIIRTASSLFGRLTGSLCSKFKRVPCVIN